MFSEAFNLFYKYFFKNQNNLTCKLDNQHFNMVNSPKYNILSPPLNFDHGRTFPQLYIFFLNKSVNVVYFNIFRLI